MDSLDEPRVSRATGIVVIGASAIITYATIIGALFFVAWITGNDPAPADLTAAAAMVLVAVVAIVLAVDMRDQWSRWVGGSIGLFAVYVALSIVGVIG